LLYCQLKFRSDFAWQYYVVATLFHERSTGENLSNDANGLSQFPIALFATAFGNWMILDPCRAENWLVSRKWVFRSRRTRARA